MSFGYVGNGRKPTSVPPQPGCWRVAPFLPHETLGTCVIAAIANVTAESLMDQAETILAKAMQSGQLSAAVSALKEKGVLSGKRIERSEIGAPGEFDAISCPMMSCSPHCASGLRAWRAARSLRSATDRSPSMAAAVMSDRVL
jgi:hypothetical protein